MRLTRAAFASVALFAAGVQAEQFADTYSTTVSWWEGIQSDDQWSF
jgi:hypothetical protein